MGDGTTLTLHSASSNGIHPPYRLLTLGSTPYSANSHIASGKASPNSSRALMPSPPNAAKPSKPTNAGSARILGTPTMPNNEAVNSRSIRFAPSDAWKPSCSMRSLARAKKPRAAPTPHTSIARPAVPKLAMRQPTMARVETIRPRFSQRKGPIATAPAHNWAPTAFSLSLTELNHVLAALTADGEVRPRSPSHLGRGVLKWCRTGVPKSVPRKPARSLTSKIGSGTEIRTLNLSVNRSLQLVRILPCQFAECRLRPPCATVCRRRCCTKIPRRLGTVNKRPDASRFRGSEPLAPTFGDSRIECGLPALGGSQRSKESGQSRVQYQTSIRGHVA